MVRIGLIGMGLAGIVYGLSTSIPLAIVLVMISGFFNSPSSVARSVLLQRHTPREMRGRVFSAFYVMRDVIFLFGMAGAGLADVDRPPGARHRRLGLAARGGRGHAARTRHRIGDAASGQCAVARVGGGAGVRCHPFRPATVPDFDRMALRFPTFSLLDDEQRAAFLRDATIREVPAGTRVVEHGDAANSAYFILEGQATAGIPEEGGYRGLATMLAGDFFGEIAALTGSPRTADVVADTDMTLLEVPAEALRATMTVPEISKLVLSTLTSRLIRTESADLPRLAGIDQEDLRDLRTRHPNVEALPPTLAGEAS